MAAPTTATSLGSSEPPKSKPNAELAAELASCTEQTRRREPPGAASDPSALPSRELYERALAHERDGALDQARKAYFELIQQHPQSAYVPHAYFAFGSLFEREAETEPVKAELAAQSYEEVLKYPSSPFIVIARVRLASVLAARKPERALVALRQVQGAEAHDAPCAQQAAAEAERLLSRLQR